MGGKIMPRRFTKHHGDKTSPAQQRINRAQAVATLARLLQLNFPDGARLIVLAYDEGSYCPVGVYAKQDVVDWVGLSRRQMGGVFQYVRVMEQDRATIHHVVTPIQRAEAERLAANWKYGPAWVDEITDGQLPALAEQFAGKAEGRRHSWSTSRGLKRS